MRFASRVPTLSKQPLKLAVGLFAAILLLYYPVGMIAIHKVDDNPNFTAGDLAQPGGSEAVAVTAALVRREISRHWTPNDPFFYPSWALVRMPAFQRGLISGAARFSFALSDQIARTRGSSTADPDLQKAVGLLNYPPTVWMYDTSVSWLPTASSESQYASGVEALLRYNTRLTQGQATFERRADNLLNTLERFAADLGAASGAVEDFTRNRSAFAFRSAAALYYETKGKMYVYSLLMNALGKDFKGVIHEKQLENAWAQTVQSLQEGASLSTFVVINAAPDSTLFASHLAAQGFYLLRARTQLREITDILLK